jgi:hypothetical protein
MSRLLSNLFPSRRPTVRRAFRPAARRPRLGVEALDDRCLPSVSTSLSPAGVLSITATGNCDVTVAKGSVFVGVSDANDGGLAMFPTAKVGKVVFDAGPGLKICNLHDNTDLNTDIYARASVGSFYGGSGVNTFYGGTAGAANFYGGSGTNSYYDAPASGVKCYAGAGDNVLHHTNIFNTPMAPQAGVTPRSMLTLGLNDNAYRFPAALNAPAAGGITAFLDGSGHVLTVCGPTGSGFRIDGNWTDNPVSAGTGLVKHQFTASGAVQLETGILVGSGPSLHHLAIPLSTLGQNLVVSTKPNGLSSPAGQYDGITWSCGVPLTQDSGGSSAFSDLLGKVGLSFSAGGASWGVKLGSDLTSTGLPLLRDVPYLYLTSSTSSSVNFGDHVSASTNGQGFALVFDPADPAVYAQYSGSSGTFSVGVSLHGAIPYAPLMTPDRVGDPGIYGNLYVSGGQVALGDLPFTVSGSAVIDLDANNDGTLVGLNKDSVKGLLNGSRSLKDQLGDSIRDVKVGFNGGVAASTEAYGFNLSADMAQGSAFYTPDLMGGGGLAFRVATVNPFEGTVLSSFKPKTQVDVGGYVARDPHGAVAWGFRAQVPQFVFGNMPGGTSLLLEGDSATNTVHAGLQMPGMLGMGKINLDGTVNLSTGDFDLRQTASFDMDIGVAQLHAFETVDFSYHQGSFGVFVVVSGYFQAGSDDWNLHGSLYGQLSVTGDSSGDLHFSGTGAVSVGITAAGISTDASVGLGFDDSGFDVNVLGEHIHHDW